METLTLNEDIKVFYVTAESFPEGIVEAHEKIHALVPLTDNRNFFGISRPENGRILYKAAVEERTEGEAEARNCKTLVLKKGRYVTMTIHDYMKNIPVIKQSFDQLLAHPGLDPEGYCVEWYLNDKELRCMVRLKD